MLVRLFGENFGVFRDEFSLSLEAAQLPSETDRGYFELDIVGESQPLRLLRMLAVFGPNASGKSTLIRAAHALSYLIERSGPSLQEGHPISQYEPFLGDSTSRFKPSTLGCEVVLRSPDSLGPRYTIVQYAISFNREEVVSERVVEFVGDKERIWLQRTGPDAIEVNQQYLPGPMTIDLAEVTRRNAAAISIAAQLKQKPLLPIFRELERSLWTLFHTGSLPASLDYSVRRMDSDDRFRNWALEKLLKPADIGVVSVTTRNRPVPAELVEQLSKVVPSDEMQRLQAELQDQLEAVLGHRGVDQEYQLDFGRESSGTQKMLALAGPWDDIVNKGGTVFIDELSASLHPTLLLALLDALNAPATAKPSQVVFTIHDPTPLDDALRRDQVYFTEKSRDGVASLYPLMDFRERKEHNIRKRYLEGRYGAIPRYPDFGGMFDPEDVCDGAPET